MAVITIPDALRERLGEEATRAFVDVIKEVDSESKKELATKADLKEEVYKINERISKLDERITIEASRTNERITIEASRTNERITSEISKVNERITEESSKVNERITEESSKLMTAIEKSSKEHVKWMFLFWIGQIAVMTGFFTVMLKLFYK
ncbi:MAG: DUF1640 domain-containing protein [Nitrospirae bacterium]|nr:DUF1640 domain-containing protein [Nitrospirota bacterium]